MNRLTLALSLIAFGAAAQAAGDHPLHPVYAEAGQFTATLDRSEHAWRLAPIGGEAVEVRGVELCPSTVQPSAGLWFIGRDADGRPELVAPSATLLPEGHSGRVALRACDDPELRSARVEAYGVPGQLLGWLASEAGAVMVDD